MHPWELPVHEPWFPFVFSHRVQHQESPSHAQGSEGVEHHQLSHCTATAGKDPSRNGIPAGKDHGREVCVGQISAALLSQRIPFPGTKPKGEQAVQENSAKQMERVWTRSKIQTLTSATNPSESATATGNKGHFRPLCTGATTEELESEEAGRRKVQILFFFLKSHLEKWQNGFFQIY